MPRAVSSRCFAFLALACFALAQPVVACAALCVLRQHHAADAMPGMDGASRTLGAPACHTGITDAVRRIPLEAISPMVPTRARITAVVPDRWVDPVRAVPTLPRPVVHTLEPPPPRLV
ncbi:MAG: hypothetical protein ACJ8DC_01405 [Gemmatimonadales bacterium]